MYPRSPNRKLFTGEAVVVHAFNPSTLETEAAGFLVAQPGLQMASSQFNALWRLGKRSWLGTSLIRTWRLSCGVLLD